MYQKRIETWRNDQMRKLLYFLDKETINLWRIDKTKNFGLGVINGEKVTRKLRVSLTRDFFSFFLSFPWYYLWTDKSLCPEKEFVVFLHLLFLLKNKQKTQKLKYS